MANRRGDRSDEQRRVTVEEIPQPRVSLSAETAEQRPSGSASPNRVDPNATTLELTENTSQPPAAAVPSSLPADRPSAQHQLVDSPVRIGRYVVLRSLGQGGMGTVYSAYDPDLDRKLAVKVVREDAHRGELARARLLKEAKAMARISHPNVVHVYEVGEDRESAQGQIFIAMEFVAGMDLVDWQQQHPVRDAVSLDRCLRIYLQAAAGIGAAHRSNLIHRDFKPDNLQRRHGPCTGFPGCRWRRAGKCGRVLTLPQHLAIHLGQGRNPTKPPHRPLGLGS